MEQSGANSTTALGASGSPADGNMESPRGGVSGLSGLSARYRSFSPGGVVQSQHNQTMLLRSAAMQLAGSVGKDSESQGVSRALLRKNCEALEEKIVRQLRRENQDLLSGMEKRVSGTETVQKKLERRFAEVAGNWKGLSEEMQSQIRRSEQLDSRLGEVRRQVTEELRQRNMDFEQKLQKATSASRFASTNLEEQIKRQSQRMQVIESFLEERMKHEVEASETLGHLSARILALEESHGSMHETPMTPTKAEEPQTPQLDGHPLLLSLQRDMQSVTETLERTAQETHELHAQLGAQEERLSTLRTLFEARDRDLRAHNHSSELEEKFELLRQQIHEKSLEKAEHIDSLEVLHRKLASQEQAHDELRGHLLRSRVPGGSSVGGGSTPQGGFLTPGALPRPATSPNRSVAIDGNILEGLEARVEDSEGRIGQTVEKIVARMEEMQLTMQQMQKGEHSRDEINHLLEQLKGVAPRIVEHDLKLKDHNESHTGHQDTLKEHSDALSRIQKAVDELGNTHKSLHQEHQAEFTALWKKSSDWNSEDQLSVLTREVTSAMEGCHIIQGEVKTLRDALAQVSHISVDDFKQMQNEFRSAMQCCSKMEEHVRALRGEPSQELQAFSGATSSDLQVHGETTREHAKKLEQLLEFRDQSQELHKKLQSQHEVYKTESNRNLEALRESLNDKLLELNSLRSERDEQPSLAIRHELEAIKQSTSSDLRGHGERAKELASKIEELLDLKCQMQELQQKLSTCVARHDVEAMQKYVDEEFSKVTVLMQDLQTKLPEDTLHEASRNLDILTHDRNTLNEASRNLDILKHDMNNQYSEMKNLMLERSAQSDLAIRNELEAMKVATSSDLRRHGETTHAQAQKIEELLDLKRHVQDLQEKLSTHVPRNDFEAMQKHIDENALKITVLMQELQTKLPTDREATSSDLQGHMETTREHAKKLEQLLEFRDQSQHMQKELQSQHEVYKTESNRNLEALRESLNDKLLELKGFTSERDGEVTKEHEKKLEQLLEFRDQSQQLQKELQSQHEVYKTESNRNLEALRGSLDDKLLELKGLTSERDGEVTKEHEKKLEQLLEFRDQSQQLHKELQSQHEVYKMESNRNLEALRESLNDKLLELKGLTSERDGEVTKEHEKKLEQLLEFRDQSQEMQQKLKLQQEEHSTNVSSLKDIVGDAVKRSEELSLALRSESEAKDAAIPSDLQAGATSDKLTELANKIADLEGRMEKLGTSAELAAESNTQALGNSTESEGEKLLELINAVSQDDEAEQKAHSTLLGRIDELCEHLLAAKSAADNAQVGANGVPPVLQEWQKRIEERVKEMNEICSNLRPKSQEEDV